MNTRITNYAEIGAATNALGLPDIDSEPDGDDANDAGGAPGSSADNATPGNGTGTPGDGTSATDEDDHDPAQITVMQVFDLALRKVINTVVTPGPFMPDSDIVFTIRVYNQGTLDGTNIQVTDYIPAEMDFVSVQTGAILTSLNNMAIVTDNGSGVFTIDLLKYGDYVDVGIRMHIKAGFMDTRIINWAEISSATNVLGQPDIDSDPDGTNFNQPGETDDLIDDNVVNQDGKNGGDEDDHDPEEVEIAQIFDLALEKTLYPGTPEPLHPGDEVTFMLKVYNQGTLDATNVQISDYIPDGLMLNDTDWSETGGIATLNTPIPSIGYKSFVNVFITFKIEDDFQGTSIRNWAEISSAANALGFADIDSDPDGMNFNQPGETDDLDDDNQVNGNGKNGGDEDDHDPAEIGVTQVFDLALRKTLSPATPAPIIPGNTYTFLIEVINQGSLDATDIQVSDYIPNGLILSDPNWTAATGIATLNTPIPFLAGHSSTTLSISFTIDPAFSGTSIRNWAEISAATNALDSADVDSTPDGTNFNQPGETDDLDDDNQVNENGKNGGDEDDHDPAELALLCPTIVATDATLTIPACLQEAEATYSFNLLGVPFENFSLDYLVFDINGVLAANGITAELVYHESTGTNAIYFEYELSGITPEHAMTYDILIGFDLNKDGVVSGAEVCEPIVLIKYQILTSQPTTDYQSLSCTGTVNVRLDDNCEAQLVATQLLNGALVCDQDFCVETVRIINGRSYVNEAGKIPADWGCGRYIYRVYVKNEDGSCGELVCWGYVNAEDKTAPEIYCPDDKHYGQRSSVVYEIVGDLGENDDVADADDYNGGGYDYQFDPTIQTCFRTTSIAGFPTLDLLGNARYFDLHEFRVSATGIYTTRRMYRNHLITVDWA
ncbi:MAG: DUF11 domain-containing protein [Saprospiraceae bacterium]|nr:DUF11 domain-containing protein [Saprospiraceae bacterium]